MESDIETDIVVVQTFIFINETRAITKGDEYPQIALCHKNMGLEWPQAEFDICPSDPLF